jgi:hypothetical protein
MWKGGLRPASFLWAAPVGRYAVPSQELETHAQRVLTRKLLPRHGATLPGTEVDDAHAAQHVPRNDRVLEPVVG